MSAGGEGEEKERIQTFSLYSTSPVSLLFPFPQADTNEVCLLGRDEVRREEPLKMEWVCSLKRPESCLFPSHQARCQGEASSLQPGDGLHLTPDLPGC